MIAVIDDDASVRRSLARLLAAGGRHTLTFASAEEFLGRTDMRPLACLILDLRLPDLSGLGLLRRLRDSGQRVPVVFITAHSDLTEAEALAAGAAAFLHKPFAPETLLTAIALACGPGTDEPPSGTPRWPPEPSAR